MEKTLFTLNEVSLMIKQNKHLILAGDNKLLSQLPSGSWIGGSTPYFVDMECGKECTDKIFVTDLTEHVKNSVIKSYTEKDIENIYLDAPDNGVTVLILPPYSNVQAAYALGAPTYKNFARTPLIGWVASHLYDADSLGKGYTYLGGQISTSENLAVAMHIELKEGKYAELNMINYYHQGQGDTIEFLEDGFQARNVLINGKEENLAEYIKIKNIDSDLPIVADLNTVMMNVGVYGAIGDKVKFYGPVFKGFKYKFGAKSGDMVSDFQKLAPQHTPTLAAVCLSNYQHAKLEGRHFGKLYGPVVNGEICYQFINHTIVTLDIKNTQEN